MADGDLQQSEEVEIRQELAMLAEALATETEFYTVAEVEARLAALAEEERR